MKKIVGMGLAVLLVPITALFSAVVMTQLWNWYVAKDFGAGPDYSTWFGLSLILSVAVAPSLMGMHHGDEDAPIQDAVVKHISAWAAFALVLMLAWVVGFAFHWR